MEAQVIQINRIHPALSQIPLVPKAEIHQIVGMNRNHHKKLHKMHIQIQNLMLAVVHRQTNQKDLHLKQRTIQNKKMIHEMHLFIPVMMMYQQQKLNKPKPNEFKMKLKRKR